MSVRSAKRKHAPSRRIWPVFPVQAINVMKLSKCVLTINYVSDIRRPPDGLEGLFRGLFDKFGERRDAWAARGYIVSFDVSHLGRCSIESVSAWTSSEISGC